jgi:hypothetical protein
LKTFITILRWLARIISLLALLLFVLLFIEDGLPLILFGNDEPALAFHMWALLIMLVGLPLGWKREGFSAALVLGLFLTDEIALFIFGAQFGLSNGLANLLAAVSFPIVLIPLSSLLYLICGLWEKKNKFHPKKANS